ATAVVYEAFMYVTSSLLYESSVVLFSPCTCILKDRLGNLGVIDDKYDVAISTACSSLEYIVVDAVECGQSCIEYLRRQNLGRARFYILEKIPSHDMSRIQTPE